MAVTTNHCNVGLKIGHPGSACLVMHFAGWALNISNDRCQAKCAVQCLVGQLATSAPGYAHVCRWGRSFSALWPALACDLGCLNAASRSQLTDTAGKLGHFELATEPSMAAEDFGFLAGPH